MGGGSGRWVFGAGCAVLWLLSLGLRLLFLHGLHVEETLRADGWRYAMLAWNLANRGAYSDASGPPLVPHMRWPPGYPLLLAPFYLGRDLQAGTAAALSIQVVAASLLPLLVIALARRMLPAWAAWVAGLLAACCPVLVTTPAFLVTESDYALLLLVLLLLLARLLDRPTTRAAVGTGLIGGAVALVRSAALGLPAVAALHLLARGAGLRRGQAALLLVLSAAAVTLPWEVRNRVEAARGVPAPSYFARPLAEGIYPELRYGDANRGYAFAADPRFPEFSTSIRATLAELWRRTRADPWPNLRWNLFGRWVTLWEFGMIQSPPIHIYPVTAGLFRPAAINPAGRDEPLAAFYRLFRGLYYFAVLPAVLIGAVRAVRGRGDPSSRARLTAELVWLTLGYTVVLHGVLIPEPRFMIPMRPLLFVLALATVVEVGGPALADARRLAGALRWENVLFATASLALALGITEGITRLTLQARLAVTPDERNLLYDYHPVLGWFPRPSGPRRFTGERPITVSHNALGFRDRDHDPRPTDGRARIVVVGDSFVWGYDVEAAQRFTDVLGDRHPEWEILNLGVSGYGTDQEVLLLEEFVPRLAPDVVVLEFNRVDRADNRLALNHGGYGKPYFVRDGTGLHVTNVPVPRLGRYADSGLYRVSYLWRLIRGAPLPSPVRFVTEDLTEPLLDRARDTAQAVGARFVVLLEGSDEAVERHAHDAGYAVAAVETGLQARAAQGVAVRYAGHGMHWTPDGHLVVAGALEPVLDAELRTAANPTDAGSWITAGRRHETRGAWGAAADAYEHARAADPANAEAAMLAGLVYHHRLRDPGRAVERYDAVLQANPTHYGAHYQKALALLASGRTPEARAAWQQFVVLAVAVGDGKSLDAAPAALRGEGTEN